MKVGPLLELAPNWRAFLARVIREEDIKLPRAHQNTGRPLGEQAFLVTLEQNLGGDPEKTKTWPQARRNELGIVSSGTPGSVRRPCEPCGGSLFTFRVRMPMRLLFASIHSYLDPSSGAALATRELLELLAGRGIDCRALSAGVLDYERETSLEEVLTTLELSARRVQADLWGGGSVRVVDLTVNGVRVAVLPTSSSRAERSPDPGESAIFLNLADQVLERFRPDVMLTYGGHPACVELMRRARQRGIAVVFHLHNFGYNDRRAFEHARAVIFPSEYSRRYHARRLGIDGPVIPYPIPLDRIVAENPEPRYLTFINPQLAKGLTVFARIAMELNARGPTSRS